MADEPEELDALDDPVEEPTEPAEAEVPTDSLDPEDAPADGEEKASEPQTPESYELKLPEGAVVDESVVSAAEEYARSNGLSNEAAQGVVDLANKTVSDFQKANLEAFEAEKQKWRDEVKADPELGGANYEKALSHSKKALAKFGDVELNQDLKESGLAHKPSFRRLLARVGKALAEDDRSPGPGSEPKTKKTAEQILYSNSMPEVNAS